MHIIAHMDVSFWSARPTTVPAGSDHYFHTECPSVIFPHKSFFYDISYVIYVIYIWKSELRNSSNKTHWILKNIEKLMIC